MKGDNGAKSRTHKAGRERRSSSSQWMLGYAFGVSLLTVLTASSCIVDVKDYPEGRLDTTSSVTGAQTSASSTAASTGGAGGTSVTASTTGATGGNAGGMSAASAGGAGGQVPTGPASCEGFMPAGSGGAGGAVPKNGITDCGSNQDANCCLSIPVPGGTFNRLNSANYPATISGFRLDKFEVTVGRFRRFVEFLDQQSQPWAPAPGAGKHQHLAAGGLVESKEALGSGGAGGGGGSTPIIESGWDPLFPTLAGANVRANMNGCTETNWTDTPGDHENHPVNCISWFEAYAFCIYDGGFLPTDAEWLYAAAGGPQQRTYPWGPNSLSPTRCITNTLTPKGTRPVGSVPAGDGNWGHSDLCGNVWEYNLDFYWRCGGECTYRSADCVDCANLNKVGYNNIPSANRIIHGGAWEDNGAQGLAFKNSWYSAWPPGSRLRSVGVRCARAP